MLLKILYSLEKDIQNYQIIAHAKYKGQDSKVLQFFNKRFRDDYSNENISKFIASFVEYNKIDFQKKLAEIMTSWSRIESEYKKRMDAIFSCNYPMQQLTAYLTTNDRCAIASDYFFVTAYSKQPMRIICHEILHFYTYYIFGEDLKAMPEKNDMSSKNR